MKICIVIPDEGYRSNAGFRIRYSRIKPYLEGIGFILDSICIDMLDAESISQYDIFIISKCYDARSIYFCRSIYNTKMVGIDIFDDYFSQVNDARFARQRYWLRNILNYCHFSLTSTQLMKEVIHSYAPNLPVEVLDDPYEFDRRDDCREIIQEKISKVNSEKKINILWFGIGDNPNFEVGLSDLSFFAYELLPFLNKGYDINLKVLTNARSLSTDSIKKLNYNIPFPFSISLWSEAEEVEALKNSFVTFLPVNCQSFSAVKSLNRAVTSLAYGNQVLSVGFPLYNRISSFIYRSAEELVASVESDSIYYSSSTVDEVWDALKIVADPSCQAMRLKEFLSQIIPVRNEVNGMEGFAIIHGRDSVGASHKFVRKFGNLSVASPYCNLKLHFDLRVIFGEDSQLEVLVLGKSTPKLNSAWLNKINFYKVIDDQKYFRVETESIANLVPSLTFLGDSVVKGICGNLGYEKVMMEISSLLKALFSVSTVVISDHSSMFRLGE